MKMDYFLIHLGNFNESICLIETKIKKQKKAYPFFVNVQSDLLDKLNLELLFLYHHVKHWITKMRRNFVRSLRLKGIVSYF